jgi:hypothetical protein
MPCARSGAAPVPELSPRHASESDCPRLRKLQPSLFIGYAKEAALACVLVHLVHRAVITCPRPRVARSPSACSSSSSVNAQHACTEECRAWADGAFAAHLVREGHAADKHAARQVLPGRLAAHAPQPLAHRRVLLLLLRRRRRRRCDRRAGLLSRTLLSMDCVRLRPCACMPESKADATRAKSLETAAHSGCVSAHQHACPLQHTMTREGLQERLTLGSPCGGPLAATFTLELSAWSATGKPKLKASAAGSASGAAVMPAAWHRSWKHVK